MKLIKIFDYFFLLRPIILIPFWTFFLLGYYHAVNYSDKLKFTMITTFPPKMLPLMFVGTAFFGIVYIINQIVDREIDKINNKLFFIPQKIISIKRAYIEASLLFIAAIFTLILSEIPLIPALLIFSILIVGVPYSVPPLRFKGRPILDILSNALVYGCAIFSAGWMLEKSLSLNTIVESLPYLFSVAATFINTTVIDIKGDKLEGLNTTGIWLGEKKASLLSLILIIIVLILSIYLKNWICFIPAIASLPFFAKAFFKQDRKSFMRSVQIPSKLIVIISAIIFPYYLIFLILLYVFTKWYYKKRFDISYP
jgi:4-hydroxybenzoate polyprenyltransferase